MEVERNWTRTRYTFICEDEKDKEFLDKMNKYIDKLEEENRTLKDKIEFLTNCLDDRDKSIELLKEERDNFMLKYSKAVEEKVVETNKLCTESNKLEQENKKLKSDTEHTIKFNNKIIGELKLENKKLKEKLDAFESSKFNTMALLEIQHPKTAREAENLLQVKKVFERLYNDRLYCLEEENKSLKRELDVVKWIKNSSVNVLINTDSKIKELEKENKYRRNQIKELKKELKAKKELLRYYQKKSGTIAL